MIQLNSKLASDCPAKLLEDGKTEAEALKGFYASGVRQFIFKKSIYGHSEVKGDLIKLQHYKCCFCESKIGHIDYGDVEHFRPKGGWVQDDEPINTPGYYWLAYDWENLFLSCKICNQRYKKNYFPLLNDNRAVCHSDEIGNELPVFINPVFDNPELHIEFRDDEVFEKDNSPRGKATIEKLGLRRVLLTSQRREKLKPIKDLYEVYQVVPAENVELKNKVKNLVEEYCVEAHKDNTEYASMLRCFFRGNPIDF